MGSNISEILKKKRKGLGLSVKSVLDELRSYGIVVSDKTLYGWESGHRQPDADTFLALCRIYGIDTLKGIKNAPSISDEAMKLAKDYDGLDTHGQRVVRLVADEEKARLGSEKETAARLVAELEKSQPSGPKIKVCVTASGGTYETEADADITIPESVQALPDEYKGKTADTDPAPKKK